MMECLKKGDQMDPLGSAVPSWAQERPPGIKHHLLSGVGALSTEASAPQCSRYAEEGVGKNHKKVSPSLMNWDGQINGPSISLHQDSSRVHWPGDVRCAEQAYWGEFMPAPSKQEESAQNQQKEEYMAELCLELSWCMARAGLWDASVPARPTSWGRRCSHGHSSSWTQSPSAGPKGAEAAKWLREDSLMSCSRSRGWCSCS